MPYMKCSGSRGPATCVGGGLPMTKGVCQCKFGSCGADGKCPRQSSMAGVSGLFDDSTPAVEEDEDEEGFAIVGHASLGLLGVGLFLAFATLGLRMHRGARIAASLQAGTVEEGLVSPVSSASAVE